MRIIRYQLPDEAPQYGWITGEKIGPIEGQIFGAFQRQEARIPVDAAQLLPPTIPGKIVNDHVPLSGGYIFVQPSSASGSPGVEIILIDLQDTHHPVQTVSNQHPFTLPIIPPHLSP